MAQCALNCQLFSLHKVTEFNTHSITGQKNDKKNKIKDKGNADVFSFPPLPGPVMNLVRKTPVMCV